jgi:hypothetical protein
LRSAARAAERNGRPGMPLWRAVEFSPDLDAVAQAGLEAALEGAGLLDAWLTPDGELLDRDALDTVLIPGVAVDGPRLSAVLTPAPDAPGPLRLTLDAISLADDAPAADSVAVDTSGGFALGPLRGRFAKAQAEHIGAAARAAGRTRRREALLAEIDEVQLTLDATVTALEAVAASAERLAAEEQSFPSLDAVAAANRTFVIAEQAADQLAREHAEATAAVGRAAEQLEQARAASHEHAERTDLPSLLNLSDLRACVVASGRYTDGLEPLARAVQRARELQARAAEDRERLEELRARARALARIADREATEARRLVAEHAEREAGLSAEAGQLRERRQTVEAELAAARDAVTRLQEEDKEAGIALSTATGRAEMAAERAATSGSQREAALAAFLRLERVDIFRLALAEDTPEDHRTAAEWTLTRALEVLRAIPAARLVRESADKLAGSLTRSCSDLDRDLAQEADMSVFTTIDADGVLAVRVRDGAAERSLPASRRRPPSGSAP